MADNHDSGLAAALRRAIDERGLRIPEVARRCGIAEATLRGILAGRVTRPQGPTARALDACFAPGLVGVTDRIARGELDAYPGHDETALLTLWRRLSVADRALVLAVAERLADPPSPPSRRRS